MRAPPPPPPLILASSSPYRRAQLKRLGLDFSWESPGVDEEGPKARPLAPQDLARELALAKARAVWARHPAAVVIGGDQVIALGNERFDKPGTEQRAVAQLARLAGQTHQLWSAAALVFPGPQGPREETHVELAELRLRRLPEAALARYVAADQPLDCAGSYKLESRGIALFEAIRCADWTAIEGLPLLWVAGRLLGERPA